MHWRWIAGAVLAGVAGYTSAAAQGAPDGVVVEGIRDKLKQQLAMTPYAASDADICAMATAVLSRSDPAQSEPVDRRVGTVDCDGTFAAAGFDLWSAGSSRPFRRVNPPGRLQDGTIVAGVDYGCTPADCLGGVSYVLARDGGVWVVRDEAMAWMR